MGEKKHADRVKSLKADACHPNLNLKKVKNTELRGHSKRHPEGKIRKEKRANPKGQDPGGR